MRVRAASSGRRPNPWAICTSATIVSACGVRVPMRGSFSVGVTKNFSECMCTASDVSCVKAHADSLQKKQASAAQGTVIPVIFVDIL